MSLAIRYDLIVVLAVGYGESGVGERFWKEGKTVWGILWGELRDDLEDI
jgi:hypothetical protein